MTRADHLQSGMLASREHERNCLIAIVWRENACIIGLLAQNKTVLVVKTTVCIYDQIAKYSKCVISQFMKDHASPAQVRTI